MKELDNFYLQLEEPNKGTMLAISQIIQNQDKNISTEKKYGIPFFSFWGKMFAYISIDKKLKNPYLGIVEGKRFDEPLLISENRTRIKVMRFDPNEDLPIHDIERIIQKAISFYKSGEIKTPKKKR
jgi:hypothetical protein